MKSARDLAMIGLDRIAGYFGVDALTAWEQAGRPLATIPQLSAADLAPMLSRREVQVIDVRGASEWEAGHLPAVANIPLAVVARASRGDSERPTRGGALPVGLALGHRRECAAGGRDRAASRIFPGDSRSGATRDFPLSSSAIEPRKRRWQMSEYRIQISDDIF